MTPHSRRFQEEIRIFFPQPQWLSWLRLWLVIRRLRVLPPLDRHHSFVEIWSWNIFYSHSLPLIQEGQFSISGKRMCAILVNHLEDLACSLKVWLGKLTMLNMTPLSWLGHKISTQTKINAFLVEKKCLIWSCRVTMVHYFHIHHKNARNWYDNA